MTMKTNPYRSHSVAAALAATIVTTVLVASLVESFDPAQLIQFSRKANPELAVALAGRQPGDSTQV
jgi:hypothetical protein